MLSDEYAVVQMVRDLPLDFTVLLENIVDFDHGPFAHQALAFDMYSGRGLHSSTIQLNLSRLSH